MPERKINDSVMLAMLDKGKKQVQVAEFFGVSPQAISDRVKKLKGGMVKVAVMEKGAEILDKNLNAVEQLQNINKVANQLLDELTGEDQTINRMVGAIEAVLKFKAEPTKENEQQLKQIILQISRDKNTAIKACAEIRGQIKLQFEILQGLYNIETVAEFQKEVIQLLKDTDPELRDEFLRRLRQRRGLRNTVSIS